MLFTLDGLKHWRSVQRFLHNNSPVTVQPLLDGQYSQSPLLKEEIYYINSSLAQQQHWIFENEINIDIWALNKSNTTTIYWLIFLFFF